MVISTWVWPSEKSRREPLGRRSRSLVMALPLWQTSTFQVGFPKWWNNPWASSANPGLHNEIQWNIMKYTKTFILRNWNVMNLWIFEIPKSFVWSLQPCIDLASTVPRSKLLFIIVVPLALPFLSPCGCARFTQTKTWMGLQSYCTKGKNISNPLSNGPSALLRSEFHWSHEDCAHASTAG